MMTPEAPYSYRYSCSTTSENSAGVPTAYRRLPTAYSTSTSTAYCLPPTVLPPASCLLPHPASYLLPASCLCYTPHTGANDVLRSASPFCKGFLSFFLSTCLLPTADSRLPTAYRLLPTAYILPIQHCLAILPTSTAYCIYCLPIYYCLYCLRIQYCLLRYCLVPR